MINVYNVSTNCQPVTLWGHSDPSFNWGCMEVTSTVTMAPHSALNVPGVVVGGTVVSESIGSFVCVVVSDTGPQALYDVSEAGYAESGLEFGLGLAVFVLLLVLIRRGMNLGGTRDHMGD